MNEIEKDKWEDPEREPCEDCNNDPCTCEEIEEEIIECPGDIEEVEYTCEECHGTYYTPHDCPGCDNISCESHRYKDCEDTIYCYPCHFGEDNCPHCKEKEE